MHEERRTGLLKCVFPVAGLGTRFLPATKASPKEMLPVVDKPLIQYAVEEAVAAGITDLIFVTGRSKRSIEDHFDKAYELEAELESSGKTRMLQLVRRMLPERARCVYVRQAEALGLGHAVACASHLTGNEPFAVSLADDLIDADPPVLKQMVDCYQYYRCSVIGVQRIPPEETEQYGIVRMNGDFHDGVGRIQAIVEKPKPEEAPSNWAVVGRYIFTPGLFRYLDSVRPGAGGEIQLTDAIASLLQHEQVLAYEFTGKRYDCGTKLGYLQANVEYGLKHAELSEPFREYLRALSL